MDTSRSLHRICDLCRDGNAKGYTVLYKTPFEVLECLNCGLVFINRKLPEQTPGGYSIERFLKNKKSLVSKAKHDFEELRELTNRLRCNKREKTRIWILDIGCGLGMFLLEAQHHGWVSCGLEINKRAAAYAREHHQLDVEVGNIEEKTKFSAESFDTITMFGVVEHLVNPSNAIEECRRLLKPDGVLCLQTPTEDGLFRKFGYMLYKISFEKIVFHLEQLYSPSGHNLCFSSKSIRLLLEWNNFQIIRIVGSTYGLKILLKRFNLNPVAVIYILGTFLLYLLAKLIGMPNHMTVYAQKKEA